MIEILKTRHSGTAGQNSVTKPLFMLSISSTLSLKSSQSDIKHCVHSVLMNLKSDY